MSVGSGVIINKFGWLLARPLPGGGAPALEIKDGTIIGHFSHITCVGKVTIEEKVLIADRVHISDNGHDFSDVRAPILEQGVSFRGEVRIGAGTWIGEGVSILGSKVGRQCVIGANAVVVSDIPDNSVAVGIPARIVKRYEPETGGWTKMSGSTAEWSRNKGPVGNVCRETFPGWSA